MRVLIRNITRKYNLYGQLPSGRNIKIRDNSDLLEDIWYHYLDDYINKEMEVFIFLSIPHPPKAILKGEKEDSPILEGKYLGEIEPPAGIELDYHYRGFKDNELITFHGIQTEDGVFYTSSANLQYYSLKPDDQFVFKVNYFNLMGLREVDEDDEHKHIEWEPYSYSYEKNYMEKFWETVERLWKESNTFNHLNELILKEISTWSFEEILLFEYIIDYLAGTLAYKIDRMGYKWRDPFDNLCVGTVFGGKRAFKTALMYPGKHITKLKKRINDNWEDGYYFGVKLDDLIVERKPAEKIPDDVIKRVEKAFLWVVRLLQLEFGVDYFYRIL